MANIRKSFNFRNGVQVDNNNFVVNANGLVGIGSSAPTSELDVSGGVKVSGLVTSSTLGSGIGTITNFTATNASVGVLTATTLSIGGNLVTNLVGFAFTTFVTDNGGVGLHTTSKIGIGVTTSPGASDSELTVSGNVNATGIVTANSFSGDVTGNVNATSGVSTFTELKVGTAITMSAGIITATTFSGSLPTSSLTGTISSTQIANSAVTDAKIVTMSASKLTGALPAISGASLTNVPAVSITGSPNVNLGITTSSSIISGSIVGTGLSVTSIGIGTASPANTFQQRATGATELQVTSDTASASITVGREPGTSNTNNAEFRYGGGGGFALSNAQSLDIVNYGTGNFNYYLSANNAGAAAGDYVWHKGANNDQLMSLTKDGNLGIGITDPTHKLNVQGISTFTGAAYFDTTLETGGDLTIGGNLSFGSSASITATLRGNVESGNGANVVLTVPAGNDDPVENAEIKARVVGGSSTITKLEVSGSGHSNPVFSIRTGAASTIPVASDVVINVNDQAKNKFVVTSNGGIGIGTTNPQNTLDMRSAERPVVFPNLTTSERDDLAAPASGGISTSSGSVIYNKTNNKLQVYTGSSWVDLH